MRTTESEIEGAMTRAHAQLSLFFHSNKAEHPSRVVLVVIRSGALYMHILGQLAPHDRRQATNFPSDGVRLHTGVRGYIRVPGYTYEHAGFQRTVHPPGCIVPPRVKARFPMLHRSTREYAHSRGFVSFVLRPRHIASNASTQFDSCHCPFLELRCVSHPPVAQVRLGSKGRGPFEGCWPAGPLDQRVQSLTFALVPASPLN
ncbi:hypothetical protein FA13DRAFT_658118 [Coprinellus micaceus]|uniref:Uncharacterized protein n=1 Tax=Coprinellus micaceus TaxID=71717 RepID=A0A4Y7S9S0_COPMI|nr:hypothetical protein FA13DRAFT_658118 [Coprinellus micaceus]